MPLLLVLVLTAVLAGLVLWSAEAHAKMSPEERRRSELLGELGMIDPNLAEEAERFLDEREWD